MNRNRIIWQDSLLSISYDRASSILLIDRHSPKRMSNQSRISYAECMHNLCQIGLGIVQKRAGYSSATGLSYIMETQKKLETIMDGASEHLQDAKMCRSMRDQLEHWNLQMHRSYVMSELCRPVLTRSKKEEVAASRVLALCVTSLTQTVSAFINLQRITSFAKQSWAAVHRSLSSALLLCIVGETNRVETTRKIISELIDVMSDLYSDSGPSEVPTPISRSIAVLEKFISSSVSFEQQAIGLESAEGAGTTNPGLLASPNASPSTIQGSSSDAGTSPYSMMNHILWGKNRDPSL